MKKKTIRIEAKHVNNEDRKKANEIYVRNKIKTAQKRVEQEKRTLDSELKQIKKDNESEREKANSTYTDDSTVRDIELQKLDLQYKEKEHNLIKRYSESINKWKKTADQPLDGDYYDIAKTAEHYFVTIEDEVFKIGNWYSIYMNRRESMSPVSAYSWHPKIGNGVLNLEITTDINPVLDIKTGYDGVEGVKLLYPKVENPVGTELIIFYEDEFA